MPAESIPPFNQSVAGGITYMISGIDWETSAAQKNKKLIAVDRLVVLQLYDWLYSFYTFTRTASGRWF
jgi:hypothetical protein